MACVLITGSSGHLGEGLVRTLRAEGRSVVGTDLRPGPFTDVVGSLGNRAFVEGALDGVTHVVHTATLHKPHVVTHSRRDFVESNVAATLHLLEASVARGVEAFVYTSTTSAFGRALIPAEGEPAAWITESVMPRAKNIYGTTKLAAEDLCEVVQRDTGLPCIVLRTSRFFPEEDDRRAIRERYADENVKANEYLYRRVDLQDAVDAHRLALERGPSIGFGRYIVSATTPLTREDLSEIRSDLPRVVARKHPRLPEVYTKLGWTMFPSIDRVYVNEAARRDLGWKPRIDFAEILRRLEAGEPITSPLAREVGAKGYHDEAFSDGPYPVQTDG